MKSLSKKIFLILFTLIIAAVFGLWGVGDLFSSGKSNIVAEVGNGKIYVQDYINEIRSYAKRNKKQNLSSQDHTIVLNTLISEKFFEVHAEKLGIIISDVSLANYIKAKDEFKIDGKFSRTQYEKYLLENGLNAETIEFFLKKELLKKLVLDIYFGGIRASKYHINQIKNEYLKEIEGEYYEIKTNKKFSDFEIESFYKKNIEKYKIGETRSGYYVNLSKLNPISNQDNYYKTINEIENSLINNESFNTIVKKFNLKFSEVESINKDGLTKDGKISNQSKFSNFLFSLSKNIKTEIFELNDEKYLVSLLEIKSDNKINFNATIKGEILKELNYLENKKIGENTIKNISFANTGKSLNANIQAILFKNIMDNKNIFNQQNMSKIFSSKKNDVLMIENNNKIYMIKINSFLISNKKNKNMDKFFEIQASKNLEQFIMKDLEDFFSNKYPIKINNKVFDRLKNNI